MKCSSWGVPATHLSGVKPAMGLGELITPLDRDLLTPFSSSPASVGSFYNMTIGKTVPIIRWGA